MTHERLQATQQSRAGHPALRAAVAEASFWWGPPAKQRCTAPATSHGLLALAIVVGTWLVFLPALRNGFVDFDDNLYVTANPQVQRGLSLANLLWAFSPHTIVASNWHPLTVLSHMLDCQWFGLQPAGHHATSVLLHGVNAGLLFWFLFRSTGAAGLSAWVAAMFAIHPLRVESVAWVAERKDVLSTLFWFAALLAYGRYAHRPGLRPMLVVAVLLTLGLLAKPMLVTVPIVLLLLDVWPLCRVVLGQQASAAQPPSEALQQPAAPASVALTASATSESDQGSLSVSHATPPSSGAQAATPTRSPSASMAISPASNPSACRTAWVGLLVEKLPLFGIVAAFSLVTLWAQRSQGIRSLDQLPLVLRITNALASYAIYVWQTFVPWHLAAFYPHPANAADVTHLGVATIGLLMLVVLTLVAYQQRAKHPYLGMGWFWYVVTLLPVIGLIQVGGQAHADRYTYVPQVGLLIALAWLGGVVRQQWSWAKRALPAVAMASILGVLPLTWHQIATWRDTQTLFAHALQVTNRNFLAHRALGNWAVAHGDVQRAMQHYRRVLELRPDDEQAYFDLAYAYHLDQQFPEALKLYYQGLERVETKRSRGLQVAPDVGKVHANIAQLLAVQGDHDRAIRHYRQAIDLLPTLAEAYIGLGTLLAGRGEIDAALAVYRRGLMHLPQHTVMLNCLARVLATSTEARYRDGDEAVRLAQQACRAVGLSDARLLDTLAAAYAEQGNFEAAVRTAQQALRQAMAQTPTTTEDRNQLVEQISQHILRYQRRQPLREDPANVLRISL